MNARAVRIWLDHHSFGCGWRDFIALPGRRWVHLVEVSTGDSGKIDLEEFARAERRSGEIAHLFEPRRAGKRLRANAKTYGNDKSAAVRDCLAALREAEKAGRGLWEGEAAP